MYAISANVKEIVNSKDAHCYDQGIIGSGFALQVIEQKKKQHNRKRRRPAAMLIQVRPFE